MRMRARPHLHYAPVDGGVYLSGARDRFAMRGSDLLFKVADVCVPLLETGASEDELVAALGSERARPAVRHLVDGLRLHGMMLDTEQLTVPEPPADVRAEHAESLAHLESLSDDPYAVFARLRAATVLLLGPPEAVRPAARGLTRAGVGKLVQPDSAADAPAWEGVDAALLCCVPGTDDPGDLTADEAALLSRLDGRLPAGVPLVPVLLDDRVLTVGPALHDAAGHRTWAAFTRRAQSWARAEDDRGRPPEPAGRPVADALAGALAGQLLFEVLTGLAPEGEAHLVHGQDLVADRVLIDSSAGPDQPWHPLEEAAAEPVPDTEDAVTLAGVPATRWTGLFASVMGEDLPQLPLALRETAYRAGRSGSVVAWAPEQESATVGAALETLRRTCAGPGTGAAGLTEERWLLDGALRHLTADAQVLAEVAPDELDPEAVRIRQSLERHGSEPLTLRVLHVPGLDWRLGRVESADTSEVLGLGWAPDADSAVGDALGTALARTQVPRTCGGAAASGDAKASGDAYGSASAHESEHVVALLRTDALVFADAAVVESLRKQVSARAAAEGVRYRGRSQRTDPLLGELPLWAGPVEAGPTDRAAQDATRQENHDAH